MNIFRNSLLVVICLSFFSCNKETTEQKVSEGIISNTSLERVEPPNWFIGFKDTSLQLLVKEDNIGAATPKITYNGVSITKVNKAKSPNYLFIDL